MSTRNRQRRPTINVILDCCDRVEEIRSKLEHNRSDRSSARLGLQKTRARAALIRQLSSMPPQQLSEFFLASTARSPLELEVEEAAVLAMLLHARIRDGECTLDGREILWVLADSTYDLFRASRLLHREANLARCGAILIIADAESDPRDILGLRYMLAPATYRAICARHLGETGEPAPETRPFADSTELFLAYAELSTTLQKRAAKVFGDSLWREIHDDPAETIEEIEARVEEQRGVIAARLAATGHRDRFELLRFRDEFALSEPELMVVCTILSQETLHGTPLLAPIDALSVVAASPRELLRRRQLLAAQSRLIASGILVYDEQQADKALTGQIFLASWVTERLVDTCLRTDREIAVDEKIEFHNFLSRLEGSDDFFDKL